MNARDIMTANPEVADPNTTVKDVADKMFEGDIRHLPVVNEGVLVGIVSDRDIRNYTLDFSDDGAYSENSAKQLGLPVRDIMHGDVVSVEGESELSDVIQLMIDTKVGALPVIDPKDQRLLGIISYIDVLKAAAETL